MVSTMDNIEKKLSNFDDVADAIWLLLQVARFDDRIDISKYISVDTFEPEEPMELPERKLPPNPVKNNNNDVGKGTGQMIIADPVGGGSEKSLMSEPRPVEVSFVRRKSSSSLDLQRSLRPIKIKISSRSLPLQVNIDATLYQMAKNELANIKLEAIGKSERVSLWQNAPVFQLGKEKWLDLVLVIDTTSLSMQLFENKIALLKQTIAESGIFRYVTEYYMYSIDKESKPRFSEGHSRYEHSLSEILGPRDRRVFWFVSDCRSDVWDNWSLSENGNTNSIGDVFNIISGKHPVSIMQMMPEALWSRTGLSLHELCKAWSTASLLPNKKLHTSVVNDPDDGFAIPVLTLNPLRLSAWADMVSGRVTDKAVLSIFIRKSKKKREQRPLDMLVMLGGGDALVEGFLVTAPHQARIYASYLSVLPSMSYPELLKLRKKLNPDISEDEWTELLSNLESSKLFNFIITGNERIVSSLMPEQNKILRKKISYSKQLEAMAEFYYCVLEPKFLDEKGEKIDFWVFIDDNPIVSNLDVPRVKETYVCYQDVLGRGNPAELPSEPEEIIFPVNPHLQNYLEVDSYDNNLLNNVESGETNSALESQSQPNEIILPVNSYDQNYLEIDSYDISLWGEVNSGKTSMLLSQPRQAVMEGYELKLVDHYGNLIPSYYRYPNKPLVKPTVDAQDYVYYLEKHPNLTGNKLVCLHDFPGNDTVNLSSTARVSYKHSHAIFVCLDSEKIWFPDKQDTLLREKVYDLLSWLDTEGLQPYIAICLMKTDILVARNIQSFDNMSPWAPVERFLGPDVVSLFRSKSADVFTLSSWGVREIWSPRKIFAPIEGFLKTISLPRKRK